VTARERLRCLLGIHQPTGYRRDYLGQDYTGRNLVVWYWTCARCGKRGTSRRQPKDMP
jgi:hypothetical protein